MKVFKSVRSWDTFDISMMMFHLILTFSCLFMADTSWALGEVDEADLASLLGPLCWFLNVLTGPLARIIIALFLVGVCIFIILGKMSMGTGMMFAGGAGGLLAAPSLANAISNAAGTSGGSGTGLCVAGNP